MTPDSGCYSTSCLSNSLSMSNFNNELPIDFNGSYIKYINTFALQNQNTNANLVESDVQSIPVISTNKDELNRLNTFQLNELIEQIENTTKELSETLVQVLNLQL